LAKPRRENGQQKLDLAIFSIFLKKGFDNSQKKTLIIHKYL